MPRFGSQFHEETGTLKVWPLSVQLGDAGGISLVVTHSLTNTCYASEALWNLKLKLDMTIDSSHLLSLFGNSLYDMSWNGWGSSVLRCWCHETYCKAWAIWVSPLPRLGRCWHRFRVTATFRLSSSCPAILLKGFRSQGTTLQVSLVERVATGVASSKSSSWQVPSFWGRAHFKRLRTRLWTSLMFFGFWMTSWMFFVSLYFKHLQTIGWSCHNSFTFVNSDLVSTYIP